MTDKIKNTIQAYNMLGEGERVLVALSGGADSVSLAHSLKSLGYSVFCVHVNHNLRGRESDADEAFCREFCQKFDITLFVESVSVKEYAEKSGLSLEESARHLRYEALNKHANGCKIATAHTANDSFETALFNLVRGTGVSGIGIPPTRENIIRPLISCERSEIEAYIKENELSFVTDSTNYEEFCSRNIIRLSVIPQLLRLNPSLFKTFATTQNAFLEASQFITQEAKKALENAKEGENYQFDDTLPEAVLSQSVSLMLKEQGIEPSFDKITAVKSLLHQNGKINLKKGVYLSSCEGKITFEKEFAKPSEVKTNFVETVQFGSKTIKFTKISQFNISSYNNEELKYHLDAEKLNGEFVIRTYQGNETIRLPRRGFTSTIKKLLSPKNRKESAIISDSIGAVFVEGVGVSERVCCTHETVTAVRIDITD